MALLLKYPARITTDEQRLAFALRVTDIARRIHNAGKAMMDGITRDEYDNGIDGSRLAGVPGQKLELSANMKIAYPFRAVMTREERIRWIDEESESRRLKARLDVLELQNKFRTATTYDAEIDPDDL